METQFLNANANLSLRAKHNTEINGSPPENPMDDPDLPLNIELVEKILNYKFKNKSLLQEAFTDATNSDENRDSYERLEFFGDTVLNLVITRYLYFLYPDCSPGLLTNLRAVNVDTEKLARVAVKHNLYRCLRHKKPLLEDQIMEFAKAIEEYPLHSRGLLKVPKSLADIVESTIGALFLDSNSIKTVWEVVKPLLEPIIPLEKLVNHPMTELYEMCQKKNLKLRFDDSTWEVDKNILVFIEDHLVGRGHYLVKKDSARNCAAKNAIDNFSNFFYLPAKHNTKIIGSRPENHMDDPDRPLDIEFVEKILNYEFKNESLLQEAFTDATNSDENRGSYERLEFIGDTVLNLVITQYLYFLYPDSSPGLLTKLRAVNVDTEKLARVAVKHNLYRCLCHKKPLLEDQIMEFAKAIEEYPLHSRGLLKVPKSLADIVESTIGALFLDSNSIKTVWEVVKPLLEPIIPLEKLVNHPMTELYEMCQKKNLKLRFDDSTWEVDKNIRVFIEDHLVGRGHHLVKKDSARNCAAKNAIDNFSNFF